MSWFWNSTPSREEQEIKNNISSINRELTEIATYLDHISSTGEYFHAQVIEQHFSKIEKCINNIRSAASKYQHQSGKDYGSLDGRKTIMFTGMGDLFSNGNG